MQQLVTITRQGQITIPKSFIKAFGIKGSTKAVLTKDEGKIIVEPKTDFWTLRGILKSNVVLSDTDLKKARLTFSKKWGNK